MERIMTTAQPTSLTTRSGIVLSVRPATPDDEPALAAFFEQVTDEDRRFRFLSSARHVGHAQLAPLVNVDHERAESFLAFDTASGDLVGSAMLACDAGLDTAEVAVSVRADYRGRGVGWALLDRLAQEAGARGVRRVVSIESRENRAAIALEREMGFVPEPCADDPSVMILSRTFR
jgi:acetyltransferase